MPPPGVCLNIMEARQKKEGYGSADNPEMFLNQNCQQLKQYCLIQGVRYINEMFLPDRNSIGEGILSLSDMGRVVWLRPSKIAPNPAFVVDGLSRFDFGQGLIGNCWFLASIGALTFQEKILGQVVPLEQTFEENYCGLFHFRFWRFGSWVDVIIDDKLPTINGRFIFVHSKDQNEFWPALMEKAYAKYETSDNTVLLNGLVQGHAYTVTGVKQKLVELVRLWNPWGKGEWKGDWSDRSSLWKPVSAEDREMCFSVVDDGEFWMTLKVFCTFYSNLDICSLCPDFLDGNQSCYWKSSLHEGRWVAGTTAGGCINNQDSFWTNPQYQVRIDGEYSEKHGDENMLVSLMQKPYKRNRRLVQNLHIGFSVFKTGKFPASFFSNNKPVVQSKSYMNASEVMEMMSLEPGEYLIVLSTFKPNETASFILTILSKAETHAKNNKRRNKKMELSFR
uniref:Calpain catalytic domain-containing protein n=1 Tax=Labrus bergylta TaxID=56723 RepID=A0A3Q3FZP7_9LABR